MSLPFQLSSDLNTASGFTWISGPFKPTKGTYYFIGVSAANPRATNIYEATDPTSSWSMVGGASTGLTTLGGIGTAVRGNTLIIISRTISATTESMHYQKFDMGGNFSQVSVNLGLSLEPLTTATNSGVGVGIKSNGIGYMSYNGPPTVLMSGVINQVYYRTWDTTNNFSPNTDVAVTNSGDGVDYVSGNLIIGQDDNVHIMYKSPTNTFLRTLNSSNVLQTQQTMASSSYDLFSSSSMSSGGSTYIAASGDALVSYTSSLNPTAYTVNTNNTLSNVQSYLNIFYSLNYSVSTSSITLSTSEDFGATWSTPTSIQSLTSPFTGEAALSRNGQIYQRGSRVVLPYIYRDGSSYYYNEYAISGSRYTIVS